MRMYTLADKAISEDEFSRAVTICTGRKLSPHLVHTVFQVMILKLCDFSIGGFTDSRNRFVLILTL